MEMAKLKTFSRVRTFSSAIVAIAIAASIAFSSWLGADSLNWQVVMAVVALAIGIPHGALDHLVTLPKSAPWKMALFVVIYVAIALAAIWAILQWNVWGFIAVVIMSATHFGLGDSAFISELNHLKGNTSSKFPVWAYAPAAGLLPVVIPLVNSRSTEALTKVNAELINWHYGYTSEIQIAVAAIATLSAMALITRKRYRDLLDLALLATLASVAPPLVAFAVYFGCWHAMRHTARLTSLLPRSIASYERGNSRGAFTHAVIPGLPALAGTLIFVALLAGFSQSNVSDTFLWLTLVTIWALTVPHMIVTAKLDRAALKN
ncbi:Brp/Blh family beta-carotene 15,15'-dioxygenase [Candidatus Planktophila dulcis]|uniref:Brp/Blh family beta-carotene 15,15'-dioxygenase n=1 Tax=Candidatus Planktophila dulcis TaxID=1884914 RepID=UPI003CF0FCBF